MKNKVILEFIAALLILLFLYAAVSKLLDYQKFVMQIGQSPVLTSLGSVLPPVVIGSEILICLLLTIPKFRLIAFYASFSLMTMFTSYIVSILVFASYIPCSCGGILEKLGWTSHLAFNIVFILLAGWAIVHEEINRSVNTARL